MASCLMAESSYPSQQQDKFVLRLPDGMRDRIKAAAEANNRSMNAEIVATLEEKYPAPERWFNSDKWKARMEQAETRSKEILAEMMEITEAISSTPRDQRTKLITRLEALYAEHSELFNFDIEDDQFYDIVPTNE